MAYMGDPLTIGQPVWYEFHGGFGGKRGGINASPHLVTFIAWRITFFCPLGFLRTTSSIARRQRASRAFLVVGLLRPRRRQSSDFASGWSTPDGYTVEIRYSTRLENAV